MLRSTGNRLIRGTTATIRQFSDYQKDVEMLKNFGPMSTLGAFIKSFNSQANKVLDEYMETGVFAGKLHARGIYSYIQHPLLKKYDFDVVDFAEGINEGLPNVINAIESKEFMQFANTNKENDTSLLLKDIMRPDLFSYIKMALKLRSKTFDVLNLQVKKIQLVNFKVDDSRQYMDSVRKRVESLKKKIENAGNPEPAAKQTKSMYSQAFASDENANKSVESNKPLNADSTVETKMKESNISESINESSPSNHNATLKSENAESVENHMKASTSEKQPKQSKEQQVQSKKSMQRMQELQETVDWYDKYFPKDCIVLLAKVYAETKMTTRLKSADDDDDEENETTNNLTRSAFVFLGCISGEVPLEWKIIHIQGLK